MSVLTISQFNENMEVSRDFGGDYQKYLKSTVDELKKSNIHDIAKKGNSTVPVDAPIKGLSIESTYKKDLMDIEIERLEKKNAKWAEKYAEYQEQKSIYQKLKNGFSSVTNRLFKKYEAKNVNGLKETLTTSNSISDSSAFTSSATSLKDAEIAMDVKLSAAANLC